MERIDLSGRWKFRLDPRDCGTDEHWEQESMEFADEIQIPGILQAQGYGDEIGPDTDWVSSLHDPLWYLREEYRCGAEDSPVKVPFLCQPPRHYIGKAWYCCPFEIREDQAGQFAYFHIECTKWRTVLWLDGEKKGEDMSLCTPHEFELGALSAGNHVLTVCVDNGMQLPYRPDGHGVSDALGAAWNGMVGAVELRLVPMVEIRSIQIFPVWPEERDRQKAYAAQGETCGELKYYARICLVNHTHREQPVVLEEAGGIKHQMILPRGSFHTELPGGKSFSKEDLWDEFRPVLQERTYRLSSAFGAEERSCRFGLRSLKVSDGKFWMNGRETYFRGTHFGGDYPMTGYPECDVEWWRAKMRILKEWGLNFIRFHSYCPPEAAFCAADEEGIYLQAECGMWELFHRENAMPAEALREAYRILEAFGNHPSFTMLSPSNEPAGDWFGPLTEWVEKCRGKDDRRLYTAQSGWPYPGELQDIAGTDYVYLHRTGRGGDSMLRNRKGWHGRDYRKAVEGIRYPVIAHELGQWCSYPDYRIIEKFSGAYLQPGNYEIFRESLKRHGMEGMDRSFALSSGKLQAKIYKEEIEANLRTPSLYGFELLDLRDYLGQGTALVGVLDAFWEPKGAVSADEWREFCSKTVLLARIKSYVAACGEELEIPVEVCHFGEKALGPQRIRWSLTRIPGEEESKKNKKGSAGSSVPELWSVPEAQPVPETRPVPEAQGSWLYDIKIGKNQEAGVIRLVLGKSAKPRKYTLTLEIEGTDCRNHWDLWAYPETGIPEDSLLGTKKGLLLPDGMPEGSLVVTESWSEMKEALGKGRKVLFFPDERTLDYACPPVPFTPVFWNAQMGPSWGRGMGILCEAEHPVFREFPVDYYGDWQWEPLLKGARGFRMEHFVSAPHVLVRAIDEWNRNYNMSLLFECRVGEGSLMVCTMPLLKGKEKSLPCRWLLRSILDYMASPQFLPREQADMLELEKCHYYHDGLKTLKGRIYQEEFPEAGLPELMDGDGNTFVRLMKEHPYHMIMEWQGEQPVKGIYYLPLQNMRTHEGEIRSYRIDAWQKGRWQKAAEGRLASSFDPKRILFAENIVTNRLRLTVKDGFSAEQVPYYTYDREGWHRNQGRLEDHTFAASVLDVIFDREWEENPSETISGDRSVNLTAEIDL